MFYNITDSEESIIRHAIPLESAPARTKNTLATQSTTAPLCERESLPSHVHARTINADARERWSSPPIAYIHASQPLPPSSHSVAAHSAPPHFLPQQRFHCYKVVNNYFLGDCPPKPKPGRHTIAAQLPYLPERPTALHDFSEADFCANFDDDEISYTEPASISVVQRPASLLHGLDFSQSDARTRPEHSRRLNASMLAQRDQLGPNEALLRAMGRRSAPTSSKQSWALRAERSGDPWKRRHLDFSVSDSESGQEDSSWGICLRESYWRQVFCCE